MADERLNLPDDYTESESITKIERFRKHEAMDDPRSKESEDGSSSVAESAHSV